MLPLEHCAHIPQVQSLKGPVMWQFTRKLVTETTPQPAPSLKPHALTSSRPCQSSITFICWKGSTLRSGGEGRESRTDLMRPDCAASRQRPLTAQQKRISQGNQEQGTSQWSGGAENVEIKEGQRKKTESTGVRRQRGKSTTSP